jgi:hypothetical protein
MSHTIRVRTRFTYSLAQTTMMIVWIAAIIWFFVRGTLKDPFDWLPAVLFLFSAALSLLHTFVEHTVLTDDGVDHRTWYGKKVFIPYSDLSVLNRDDKSLVLTNGTREITLGKMNSDFPRIVDFLRQKVPNQMSLDSMWQ